MAGNQFTSSFGGTNSNHIEAINFTFNFEGGEALIPGSGISYSRLLRAPITGDIEFIGKESFSFWKSMVSLCAICAVFSFGFYYLLGDFKTESASRISVRSTIKAVTPLPVLTEKDLIPIKSHHKLAIEIAAKSQSKEQAISIVGKIKQEEKTETQTSLVTTESKPAKSAQRIVSPQVRPKVEDFKTNKLAEAKKLAAKTGRYTFIKFGAEWCIPCQMMESTVLKNKSVLELLNSKFVVLDVDVDELSGYIIKEEFNVDKLPTLIILDESGTQLKRHEGGLGTSALIEMLSDEAQYIYLNKDGITANVNRDITAQRK